MALFTELVDDVILRIIDYLETEQDLNSVCLVSRRHRHLAQEQLYRRHVRFHGSWALTWAAQHDRVDTARRLLAAGADVHARTADEARLPTIVVAAQFGSIAMTKLLFETPGVDPEWMDDDTSQPLAWAAEGGHEDVVKLYLQDPRVDPNRGDPDGRTALTYAAEAGQIKIVELLLKEPRVDPTTRDIEGRQALAWAAKCNKENTSVLKALLADQRVDPKHIDDKQSTALHLAATVGIVPNLQLLTAVGIDLNQGDEDGAIPISLAAANGCLDAVKAFLADPRVDPNRKDGRGVTPLMYATITDHPAVVECFLSIDSVLVNEVAVGRTALMYAAKVGSIECIRQLLAHKDIDVNARGNDGATAFHHAISGDKTEAMKVLMADERVDYLLTTDNGWSAMHIAAANQCVEALRFLWHDGRVPLNAKDEDGQNAMAVAALHGFEDVVELLIEIEFNEDLNWAVPDNAGQLPHLIALNEGHGRVAELLDDESDPGVRPMVIKSGVPAESLPRSLPRSFPGSPLITNNLDILDEYEPPYQYQHMRVGDGVFDLKQPVDGFLIGVTPSNADHWFVVVSKPEEKAGIVMVSDRTQKRLLKASTTLVKFVESHNAYISFFSEFPTAHERLQAADDLRNRLQEMDPPAWDVSDDSTWWPSMISRFCASST